MPAPGALDARARVLLIVLLLALIAVSTHRYIFAPTPGPYAVFSGATMGTTWTVKVASEHLSPNDHREIGQAIEAALDDVNGAMSTWDPESEISRFNAARSVSATPLSPQTLRVLRAAREISRLTGGGFDVTVGPLVKAWGFGGAEPPEVAPSPADLKALKARVGFEKLILDEDGAARKLHPELEVDLSAIAKGHGVDRVAMALEGLGHRAYLVEVGGEIRAAGRKLDGKRWRVAIEQPSEGMRTVHRVLDLDDIAMATSGDYRNYYEDERGRRISHTIDPRTAQPIRHALASVTVLHPSAMMADGLATALNVMGPEAGYSLAEREGLAAHFIVRDGEAGFEARSTAAKRALLAATDAPEN